MGKLFQNKAVIIGISCVVFLCLIATAFFGLKGLMKDDGGKRKRHVAQIKMLKPPPPPKIKEKPPEPEIRKKEEIVEPEPEEQVEEELDDAMDDDLPPGEELGLDADGTGGADGFGLKAKKGGRSLIGGDGSGKSLLRRYAWYTRILQDEIREKVNKFLEEKDNIPGGKHKMLLWVMLDERGNLMLKSISKTSGSPEVDQAVEQALAGIQVSELPPEEMPKVLKIKVTFKS